MGNTQQGSPRARLKYTNNNDAIPPPQSIDDFDRRWKIFIESLDVTPQNIQNIDQLEAPQKMELLLNFESKNPKCSAFHYVTLIKGLRSFKMTSSKRKDEFQNAKQILSATEISLRTNNVEWVYDFLKQRGLEILVDYMSQMLLHLIKSEEMEIYPVSFNGTNSIISNYQPSGASISDKGSSGEYLSKTQQPLSRIFEDTNISSTRMNSSKCRSSGLSRSCSSVSKLGKARTFIVESIKECIHLCLKCFRTMLNNQRGCHLAFEYKDTINVITMCLVHPSYQTKSLVLDLLSAVCLIEGGHTRVLQAFDLFKAMTAEERRFETLMYFYRHHETVSVDDYNIDYAVSNMQFINIIVHSVDNINLRVFLQYEFTILGLDDFLKKLQERPGDRLNRQVDAYLDNLVDCIVLLEDAEAKEAYTTECEKLEKDVSNLQEALTMCEAEKSRKLKDNEDRIRKAEKELEKAKSREEELSVLVESLRSKIRDINVNLCDRESSMRKEIEELQDQLRKNIPASNYVEKINISIKPAVPVRMSIPERNIAIEINNLKETEIDEDVTNDSLPIDEVSLYNQHYIKTLPDTPLSTGKRSEATTLETSFNDINKIFPKDVNHKTDSLDLILENHGDVTDNHNINKTIMAESTTSSTMGDGPLIKWNILRSQQGTVFEDLDGGRIENQLDLDGFEKIFKLHSQEHRSDNTTLDYTNGQMIPQDQPNSSNNIPGIIAAGNGDQQEKISLLDQNRQKCLQTVVVFLKQEKLLQTSEISFREWGRPLAYAITNFNMVSEAADRLLYQLPSLQEIDMYRDITGESLNVLADEDRLVALLSCIDRVEMKLESILYMEAFDETYFILQEKIKTVASACASVVESQKLKKILEIVLAFGNRMNDSRRGKALGFRIQSLDMLPECRSPDDKWSLMNYIAFQIEDKFSDLMTFTAEMEFVEDASRVSMCNLMAAIEELTTGLDRVSNELDVIKNAVENRIDLIPSKLVNFVQENIHKINNLRTQADNAKTAFIKTVEWFGEKDLQTASPDIFFGALARFMDYFKKAVAENSRRKIGNDDNRKRNKEKKINDSKSDANRKKLRARQINADGIMDEILAGLDYQPLQAGLHSRRGKKDTCESPESSIFPE